MLETWGREAEFIPNGVPAAEPLRAATVGEWNLRAGEYIVFVGRLTPEKGVHTLIEAYESTDAGARLAIVGGSSQTDDYVRRLEAMSGPRVVFAGFAYGDDLNRLISNARFVVNPSTLEGLPIAVLEAHALGKHALASDIPAHREIVRDPRWLFPPGDAPALAARLRERLAEPIEERDAALVERVRAEYDWDKAAEKTLAMYARMMAEAK